MKRVLTVVLCMIAVCISVGCQCSHDWINATCTTAKTCKKCAETEGRPFGHIWVEASCTKAKHCSECDRTEGEPLGHRWADATVDAPQTCTRCAETQGEKLLHEALDASETLKSLTFSYPARWIKTDINTSDGFRLYPYGSADSGIMVVSSQQLSGNYGHDFLQKQSEVRTLLGAAADGIGSSSAKKEFLTLKACPAAKIALTMSIGGMSYDTAGYLLLHKEAGNRIALYSILMAEPINLSDGTLSVFEAIIEEMSFN